MKPGRNDPCICGSGRKYKQCCLKLEQPELPLEEVARRRLQREIEGLPLTLGRWVDQTYGAEIMGLAWAELVDDDNAELDLESPVGELFFSWLFYFWCPPCASTEGTAVEDTQTSQPLAAGYLAHAGHRVSAIAKRYIEAALRAPLTFIEVLSFEVGRCLRVRDLFTGAEHTVLDDGDADGLVEGSILFAMPVHYEDIVVFEMVGSTIFPPSFKSAIDMLIEHFALGPETTVERLRELDLALIGVYATFVDGFHDIELAQHDSDDEPVIPQPLQDHTSDPTPTS